MLKRSLIVLSVFILIVFVPYFLGKLDVLHHYTRHNDMILGNWMDGLMLYILPIFAIILFICGLVRGIRMLITYIKSGN